MTSPRSDNVVTLTTSQEILPPSFEQRLQITACGVDRIRKPGRPGSHCELPVCDHRRGASSHPCDQCRQALVTSFHIILTTVSTSVLQSMSWVLYILCLACVPICVATSTSKPLSATHPDTFSSLLTPPCYTIVAFACQATLNSTRITLSLLLRLELLRLVDDETIHEVILHLPTDLCTKWRHPQQQENRPAPAPCPRLLQSSRESLARHPRDRAKPLPARLHPHQRLHSPHPRLHSPHQRLHSQRNQRQTHPNLQRNQQLARKPSKPRIRLEAQQTISSNRLGKRNQWRKAQLLMMMTKSH